MSRNFNRRLAALECRQIDRVRSHRLDWFEQYPDGTKKLLWTTNTTAEFNEVIIMLCEQPIDESEGDE